MGILRMVSGKQKGSAHLRQYRSRSAIVFCLSGANGWNTRTESTRRILTHLSITLAPVAIGNFP